MRCDLVTALAQARKHAEHGIGGPRCMLAAGIGLASRDHEVLAHRQTLEYAAALRHQRDSARGDHLGRHAAHRLAEYDYLATAWRQQTHCYVHAGRLAGAVATKQPQHAGLAEFEGNVAEYVTVAVEGVDVAELERASGQDRPPACGDRQPPRRDCPRRSPRRSGAK